MLFIPEPDCVHETSYVTVSNRVAFSEWRTECDLTSCYPFAVEVINDILFVFGIGLTLRKLIWYDIWVQSIRFWHIFFCAF